MQQSAQQPVVMNFTFAAKKRKKNSSAVQQQQQQQQQQQHPPVLEVGRSQQNSSQSSMQHAKPSLKSQQSAPLSKEERSNENPTAVKHKRDGESKNGADRPKKQKPSPLGTNQIGAADESANANDSGSSLKAKRFTLFVGNMPFSVNEAEVVQHFSNCGVLGCRLLRNKGSAAGKGIAFLDLLDSKSYIAALKLHHSLMGGRQINVEPTAGGGGNSAQRKDKIELKKKRLEKVIKAGASDPKSGATKANAVVNHGKNQHRRQDASK